MKQPICKILAVVVVTLGLAFIRQPLPAAPAKKAPTAVKPTKSTPAKETGVKSAAVAPVIVDDQDTSKANLLTNPSFEQDARIEDENSVPGWGIQFRRQADAPPLSPNEISLVDDPRQAHSGRRFLRITPQNREIFLRSPQRQSVEPGLYEVSAWARGRAGTIIGAGITFPPAGFGAGFPGLSSEWKKYSVVVYSNAVTPAQIQWPEQAQLLLGVFAPGERGQGANPRLDLDDISITPLNSGLADTFSDHMVLQRDKPVPIWGWAKKVGQTVSVNFNGQAKTAVADKDGRWQTTLAPMKAGGPYVLKLDGRPVAYDVMMGDVWICSGQSNMEFGLDHMNGYFGHAPEVLAEADHPQIRLWQAPKQFSLTPMRGYLTRQSNPNSYNDFQARWDICTPDTVARGVWGGFSAVGYFFGRDIQADQKVAVGLMMIANGGTQIESFISPEGMRAIPKEEWSVPPITQTVIEKLKNTPLNPQPEGLGDVSPAYAQLAAGYTMGGPDGDAFHYVSSAYNGLMAPVFPYAVKGVLWYQGEHNGGDRKYEIKLKALISDWRTRFNDPQLPFIVAQLPFWNTNPASGWQFVREAQLRVSQTVPKVGLAVTLDLNDKEGDGYGMGEIHPKNKLDVGKRMALAARAVAYNQKLVSSGPIFRAMKIAGGRATLSFDSIGTGLMIKGEKLVGFQIAGEDKKFVDADAVIVGNTIVVSSAAVPKPVAVRYAFAQAMLPVPNLYNKEGLPASSFRTDTWATG